MFRRNLLFAAILCFVSCFALLMVASPALSQPVSDPAGPTVTAKVVADEEAPSFDKLWEDFLKVITDFRTVGIVAGFIALIGLLITVLRIKQLNAWLEAKGWKQYKVYVAAGLGGVVAFLAALPMGWLKALAAGVAGVLAGLGATGGHVAGTGGSTGVTPADTPTVPK